MADINSISKDIAVEVVSQGEKLSKIDQNMVTAENNTEEAFI